MQHQQAAEKAREEKIQELEKRRLDAEEQRMKEEKEYRERMEKIAKKNAAWTA